MNKRQLDNWITKQPEEKTGMDSYKSDILDRYVDFDYDGNGVYPDLSEIESLGYYDTVISEIETLFRNESGGF